MSLASSEHHSSHHPIQIPSSLFLLCMENHAPSLAGVPDPDSADISLNNLLMLCINDQLNSSHTGSLWAINETLAPAKLGAAAKEARLKLNNKGKSAPAHELYRKARMTKSTGEFRSQLWKAQNCECAISHVFHHIIHARR
jgi:hypothetical protein